MALGSYLFQRPLTRQLTLLVMVLAWGGIANIKVAAQTPDEYRVKAAFLLNFARFVEWPADSYGESGVLVVGIIGHNPFGGALDQLNGKTVNGRRILIRKLKLGDYLKGCQILFISSSERNRLGKVLADVQGASVLTIGELAQFNQAGGVIRFVIHNSKVQFEINAGAARKARLKISSKLMALSKGGRN